MAVYYADNSIPRRHFNGDFQDPSFLLGEPPLETSFQLAYRDMETLFFQPCELQYLFQYLVQTPVEFRIVTLPQSSNTCLEKAKLLGDWNPLAVIKAIYLQIGDTSDVIAVIVPETGYPLDKQKLKVELDFPDSIDLKKSQWLPEFMEYGTCSPFVRPEDLARSGGRLRHIIFDDMSLRAKAKDNPYDDFSVGLNHCVSLQMNYFDCFSLMQELSVIRTHVNQVGALPFNIVDN